MVLRRAYTLEAMYGFRVQDTGSNLLASIIDSVTSKVAAGVYYSYVHSSPHFSFSGTGPADATRDGHETGLSLAVPLGDVFAIGLTAKYIRITTDAANPAFDPQKNSMSAAAHPRLHPRRRLGRRLYARRRHAAAARTIVCPRCGRQKRRAAAQHRGAISLGTGAAYHIGETVTLAADFVVNFNQYKHPDTGTNLVSYNVGGAFEWLIAGKVALRARSYWDSGRPGTYVTSGLAYVGQSFAVDVGYKQQVAGGVESLIVAGVRVFLQ